MNRVDRIRGCLLGGAEGDALGAPVEFLSWPAIERKYGPFGIRDRIHRRQLARHPVRRCQHP